MAASGSPAITRARSQPKRARRAMPAPTAASPSSTVPARRSRTPRVKAQSRRSKYMGSELGDGLEYGVGVPVHLDVVPAAPDRAVGPNQERRAGEPHEGLAVHALLLPGPVLLGDGVIRIGQERK